MKPYKAMITKDDKQFLEHAKRHLGSDWEFVWQEAMDEYKLHNRESEAKRAANLVILGHLKSVGQEHWRNPDDNQEPAARIQTKPATLPERKSGKKWEGPSILDMADNNKKGR